MSVLFYAFQRLRLPEIPINIGRSWKETQTMSSRRDVGKCLVFVGLPKFYIENAERKQPETGD